MMWYGVLGTKELLHRTYKNLEQKVLLEVSRGLRGCRRSGGRRGPVGPSAPCSARGGLPVEED